MAVKAPLTVLAELVIDMVGAVVSTLTSAAPTTLIEVLASLPAASWIVPPLRLMLETETPLPSISPATVVYLKTSEVVPEPL